MPVTPPIRVNVTLHEDTEGVFHYRIVVVGRQKAADTLCGRNPVEMRTAAWFRPGDHRGRVHYDRACGECREALRV